MTEDVATMLASVSIALLAFGYVLIAANRPRFAVMAALVGFAGIALSTTWRTYLAPKLAEATHLVAQRDRALAELQPELQRQKQANSDLQAQVLELQQRSNLDLEGLSQLLKGMLVAQPTSPRLDLNRLPAVLQLARKIVQAPNAALTPDSTSRLGMLLAAQLQKVATPDFEIKAQADVEWIEGRRGTYYTVRLLDAATGQQFVFAEREYDFGPARERVLNALGKLRAQLLDGLETTAPAELFVRGSADARSFEQPWIDETRSEDMMVLIRDANDRYGATPRQHLVKAIVRNEDLPNLRARHLASLVSTQGGAPPTILDNSPTRTVADMDRTVELILFVAW